eukprot:9488179-Pyramimonas_sp.AAC.1
MGSQRQTCASHSALEAEIVAADLALRKELLAALPLWEILLDRPVRCLFLEDNQAVCEVIRAGGSMKLMHLPRTHRIDASVVSEQLSRGLVQLQCERTQNEAADIGTKRFVDPMAWVKDLYIVNIVTPKFWPAKRYQDYLDSTFSDGLPLKPRGALKPRLGP